MDKQAPPEKPQLGPLTRTLACLGVAWTPEARQQVADCQAERARLTDRDGELG